MRTHNKILITTLLCFNFIRLLAVPHAIKITISGAGTQTLLLAHYFANTTKYAVDTTTLNANGIGFFKNSKQLEPGIYLVILPDYRNIELLLDSDQTFEIQAQNNNLANKIKFYNSTLNLDFQKYKFRKSICDSFVLSDASEKNKLIEANNFQLYLNELIRKYQGTFLQRLLSSGFLDNCNSKSSTSIDLFKDMSLLRTPYFEKNLFCFLDRKIPQNSDTIKKNITVLFNNAFTSNYLYRYLSVALLKHYQHNTQAEEIFVYTAENYVIPFANWLSSQEMYELQLQTDAIKSTRIGSLAPNFLFKKYVANASPNFDSCFIKTKMHQLQGDKTILVFFDTTCEAALENYLTIIRWLKANQNLATTVLCINKKECAKNILATQSYLPDELTTHFIQGFFTSEDARSIYQANLNLTIYVLDKNKAIVDKKISWAQLESVIKSN